MGKYCGIELYYAVQACASMCKLGPRRSSFSLAREISTAQTLSSERVTCNKPTKHRLIIVNKIWGLVNRNCINLQIEEIHCPSSATDIYITQSMYCGTSMTKGQLNLGFPMISPKISWNFFWTPPGRQHFSGGNEDIPASRLFCLRESARQHAQTSEKLKKDLKGRFGCSIQYECGRAVVVYPIILYKFIINYSPIFTVPLSSNHNEAKQ